MPKQRPFTEDEAFKGEDLENPSPAFINRVLLEARHDEALSKYGIRITVKEEAQVEAAAKKLAEKQFQEKHGRSIHDFFHTIASRYTVSEPDDDVDWFHWEDLFQTRWDKLEGEEHNHVKLEDLIKREEERPIFEELYQERMTHRDWAKMLIFAKWDAAREMGFFVSYLGLAYRLKPNTPPNVLRLLGADTDNPRESRESMARKLGAYLALPAHNLTNRTARHLGGREVVPMQEDGSVEIVSETKDGKREIAALIPFPGEHVERAYGQDAALLLNNDAIKPVLDRAFQEHKEIKAKTFLAAISLAIANENPALFKVDLPDLMAVLGYPRSKTTVKYYWKHFANIIKTLAVDLSNIKVDLQSFDGKGNKRHYHGRLMTLWGYEGDQMQLPGTNFTKSIMEALHNDNEEDLIEMVKQRRPSAVKIGFDPEALAALGARVGKDTANQFVPRKLLGLKGPTFWLAMRILPMLRWNKGEAVQPHQGAVLINELTDLGYIADKTRGGKEYVGDSLRAWAKDVGELVDLGILEQAGSGFKAHRYAYESATWVNVTDELSKKMESGRVSRSYLGSVRVVYELPKGRIEERAQTMQRQKEFITKKAGRKPGPKRGPGRPKKGG